MASILDKLIYRAKNRTPILKIFDPPEPPPRRQAAPRAKPPEIRQPMANMKAPELVPIKTFNNPESYGTVPRTKAELAQSLKELNEIRAKHEAEVMAPILSYSGPGSGFGEQSGGIGLTSNFAKRATAEYNARIAGLRRELQPDVDRILPLARAAKSPPIVMAHSLAPA